MEMLQKCGKEGHIKRDCPSKKRRKTHKAKNVTCEGAEDSSESAFIAKEANQDKMVQQNEWIIDFGASKHITSLTGHKEILQNYQQFPRPQSVKLGDGRVVDALGFGNVKLRMTFKVSDVKNVTMFDVLYVPKIIR